MNNTQYVGLTISGIRDLGSVSSKLAQWLERTHQRPFNVAQVKVEDTPAHWRGLTNRLTGGRRGRTEVNPNLPGYWTGEQRFLLREFSVSTVAGHFIIQTGVNQFWDPHQSAPNLPETLVVAQNRHQNQHRDLAERADALQIDVV